MATASSSPLLIIDSHMHLFPASDDVSPATGDVPSCDSSLTDYVAAATAGPPLKGFVLVEADCITSQSNSQDIPSAELERDWTAPLTEMSWLRSSSMATLPQCLALVPWAPLPAGPAAMENYFSQLSDALGPSVFAKVKGVRYLLQNRPKGTCLTTDFIESLRLLGHRQLAFDVGIDHHRRGRSQLDECVEMIDRAHDGVPDGEKVVFILNHLCKPDFSVLSTTTDPAFIAWKTAIFTLSKCEQTYIKLSGGFSEMTEELKQSSPSEIFLTIHPWLAVVLASFGPSRIMFGSDWPVCNRGVSDNAWGKWRHLVERLCYMASYGPADEFMIWGGTACKAYSIDTSE